MYYKLRIWVSPIMKKKFKETNKRWVGDIILNKHFLFIQIPKTGTQSLVKACKEQNLIKRMEGCHNHEGLLYLENFIKNDLDIYTIVRNPFTHFLSVFFHRLRWKEIPYEQSKTVKENFELFVSKNIDDIYTNQCKFIKSNKNNKVHIFKFEDQNHIKYLNNKYDLNLKETYHINKNFNKHYIKNKETLLDFYSNKDIVNLIITKRKLEFETFNYSTDINDVIIVN